MTTIFKRLKVFLKGVFSSGEALNLTKPPEIKTEKEEVKELGWFENKNDLFTVDFGVPPTYNSNLSCDPEDMFKVTPKGTSLEEKYSDDFDKAFDALGNFIEMPSAKKKTAFFYDRDVSIPEHEKLKKIQEYRDSIKNDAYVPPSLLMADEEEKALDTWKEPVENPILTGLLNTGILPFEDSKEAEKMFFKSSHQETLDQYGNLISVIEDEIHKNIGVNKESMEGVQEYPLTPDECFKTPTTEELLNSSIDSVQRIDEFLDTPDKTTTDESNQEGAGTE